MCVSLYNVFILNKIYNFFFDKSYVSGIIFNNIVSHPDMLSPKLLSLTEFNIAIKNFGDDPYNLLSNIRKLDLNYDSGLRKKFINHTNIMNSIRGNNIFDIQPELTYLCEWKMYK